MGPRTEFGAPPTSDPDNGNEVDPAIVDHLEFYLLNYFKPGHGEPNPVADHGRKVFQQVGCASCHVTDMTINHDRRVADLETVYDPVHGIFNWRLGIRIVNEISVVPILERTGLSHTPVQVL